MHSTHINLLPSYGYRMLLVLCMLLLLQACSTIQYYIQSVNGQLEVLAGRRAVTEVLADTRTPESTRQQLRIAQQAREYAVRELGLPDNGSYRSYTDLGRRYVVWNVFAAPEFSLHPKSWCFPVAGCLTYRGYFSESDAQRLGVQLKQQGYEVYVAGVPAYSTLGWFDDPLLNTMMHWDAYDLAGLVFHELAHQQLYVKDDTTFNESFAVMVEQEGLRRWMCEDAEGERSSGPGRYRDYVAAREQDHAFIQLVLQTRHELEELYTEKIPPNAMRERKERLFERLRIRYESYKQKWHGYRGYDEWMSRDLNNAKLVSVATYHDYVPAFHYLLQELNGNLDRFYDEVAELARLESVERKARVLTLLQQAQAGLEVGSGCALDEEDAPH